MGPRLGLLLLLLPVGCAAPPGDDAALLAATLRTGQASLAAAEAPVTWLARVHWQARLARRTPARRAARVRVTVTVTVQ